MQFSARNRSGSSSDARQKPTPADDCLSNTPRRCARSQEARLSGSGGALRAAGMTRLFCQPLENEKVAMSADDHQWLSDHFQDDVRALKASPGVDLNNWSRRSTTAYSASRHPDAAALCLDIRRSISPCRLQPDAISSRSFRMRMLAMIRSGIDFARQKHNCILPPL